MAIKSMNNAVSLLQENIICKHKHFIEMFVTFCFGFRTSVMVPHTDKHCCPVLLPHSSLLIFKITL